MNYDLEKTVQPMQTVQGKIEYGLDQAMKFGDMAPSMLMHKFEETDMGADEDLYDNYARGTLTNWTPDTNKFEYEEPRGAVNRRAGRLELQYYGHRGCVDTPYRPEIFDGFMGDEDRDPRGINVDPDFKELRDQYDSRMRFVRWSPDGCDQITGGERAERKIMADQQKLIRITRDRLKVFDRQLDGRRNPLRRDYTHTSEIPKQIQVQSYGDLIKDYALTPQRRATIICREILTNLRAWRDETTDSDFAFARYSQLCRRARTRQSKQSCVHDGSDNRPGESVEESPKYYKAVGLLMSNIVKVKQQALANAKENGTDLGESVHAETSRKTAPFARDLACILRSIDTNTAFAAESATMVSKTPAQLAAEHVGRQVLHNHLAPVDINTEVIYKSICEGKDLRKIGENIVSDTRIDLPADTAAAFKTARREILSGAKLPISTDTDAQESMRTYNYHAALGPNGDRRIRLHNKDAMVFDEVIDSQLRRPNHTNYRASDINDTVEDMVYGSNAYKDRHGRGLGTKYMNRLIDRDERRDEISATN